MQKRGCGQNGFMGFVLVKIMIEEVDKAIFQQVLELCRGDVLSRDGEVIAIVLPLRSIAFQVRARDNWPFRDRDFREKLMQKNHGGQVGIDVGLKEFYSSSQICHVCGYRSDITKNLGVREWDCPQCGAHHDRDTNAAKNILRHALEEKTKAG